MEDRCICCGEIIPEGRFVCIACEYKSLELAKKKEAKLPTIKKIKRKLRKEL